MRTGTHEFVVQERSQRGPILRYGVLLALVSLLGTTLQNISTFEPQASVAFIKWAIALGLNLVAVFWWAGSAYFPKHPAADLVFTLPILVWMEAIRLVMTTQSPITGWAPAATITANYTLGVAFASLFFPANVRAYILWTLIHLAMFAFALSRVDAPTIETAFGWGVYVPIALIGVYSSWSIDRKGRLNFELSQSLIKEKAKTEEMLFSILPEEVAKRLRDGQTIADSFSDATVVFIDLVGSSSLAQNLSPRQFLSTLNDVFSLADGAAESHGVEKVKTIGDAYLAVSGGRSGGDALSAVEFARSVVKAVSALALERDLEIAVRIGINTGPVVGGVIGHTRATYDYWGDTMNVAARVESVAEPGGISVTKQTYFATRQNVAYLPPRAVILKGIGETQIYDVA